MPDHRVALRFDHHESLIDFVRQYGRPEPQGQFELLVGEPTEAESGTSDVLYLVRRDGALPDNPVYRRDEVQVLEGAVVDSAGVRRKLVWTRRADRLTALVGAIELDGTHTSDAVVFWAHDQEGLQRLITDNLRLRCDRLQVAVVGTQDGSQAYLVKAERPSFFVVDAASSWEGVTAFAALASGRLHVPYGATHPLLDLWQGGGTDATFMFGIGPRAPVHRVAAPNWGDVYGLLDFVTDGAEPDQSWSDAEGLPDKFVVPLHLVPSHREREVQVWMLPGSDRDRVERLLRLIPDADLASLHYTAQETPDGETFLLIRERIVGTGRQYIDFEGRSFAPYAGYPNLLLPTDLELEPPLRKDRYREIFSLRPGELTLVWPGNAEAIRICRLKENSFRPLPELVDYIVGSAAETLEALVARSVFSFSRLSKPPRRPRELAESPTAAERPLPRKAGAEVVYEEVVEDADADVPTSEKLVVPTQYNEPETPTLSELERQEIELETALIADGQTTDGWTALPATIKAQLGKDHETITCLKEALWLSFAEQSDPGPLVQEVRNRMVARRDFHLSTLRPATLDARVQAMAETPESDPDWLWLYVTLGAAKAEGDLGAARASGELRRWLLGATRLLEGRAADLRTKDRWLLWGSLVRISNDAIAEAKIRETLLDELTSGGLTPRDTPGFIQDRIYQSRFIDDDDADAQSEAHHALHIIEAIYAELQRAEDAALTRVGTSIMAYAFERLGAHSRAAELARQAEGHLASGTGLSAIERAWIALYLGATAELRAPRSGGRWVDDFNRLMDAHKAADLARSELEVIQRSIFRRGDADSPTEFFSPDNFRTLFPRAGNYARASKIRDELESMVGKGQFGQALSQLQELGRHAAAGNVNLDPRQFAWLLGPIVETLRRIGRVVEGVGVLKQLEAAADDAPGRSMMALYTALLRLKLAEGYVELGEETRGVEMIQNVVHSAWKTQQLQWLDHLDMLGAALESIEVTPVQRRTGPAEEVLRALFISHAHPTDSMHYRPIKLRLLDHCVEVALSKEKLSLKRYKHYLDEDEFHVRNRIVNEKLS